MQEPTNYTPPEGFHVVPFTGTFNKQLGPWYKKDTNGLPIWGIFINRNLIRDSQVPIAHGGVLMAFADFTMYCGARAAIDPLIDPKHIPGSMLSNASLATLTISMTCDFMSAVKLGDFLESRLEVGRASKGITFMRNNLMVGDTCVMQCSGTYTLKSPTPKI